jgi:fimbrial isopeptide formation D2 family protein
MASNLTLQQPENFNVEDDTWISIENSNALVNGRLIVSKTGGIEALQSESDAFHIPSWTVVPSLSPKGHKLSPGPGAEFFVDAINGVDAYPYGEADSPGSEDHPFRTLAWAFNHAAVGATTNVYLLSDVTVPKQLEEYHGRNITVQTADSVLEAPEGVPLTVFRAAAHAGHIVNISNSANYTTSLAFKNVVVDGNANAASTGSVVNAGAPASNAPVVVGFDKATVRGNTGTNGAVLNMGSAYVTATANNSVFESNTATGAGGAVYQTAGSLTVTGSEFTDNTAGSNGGAVYQANGTLSVTDSVMNGNEAGSNGGAIYQSAGTNLFDGVTMLGNTVMATAGKGRAVFYGAGSLTLKNAINIGADDADNGVWIAAAAALTLKQDGDLDSSSRVNLEGKDAAVASDKTVLVNKTEGAEVSEAEAKLYHWQPVAYWKIVELTPVKYVLGSAPNMYVANGDSSKTSGVPVGSDTDGEGTDAKPFASIDKALSVTGAGSDASHYRVSTIHVMDDVVMPRVVQMTADQYKDVTIQAWRDAEDSRAPAAGTEVTVTRGASLTSAAHLLWTKANNRMTLRDLTVDGNKAGIVAGHDSVLVYVNGGDFTLAEGGRLVGNFSASNSGAVYTESKFTMTGGEISGNQSGSDRGIITVPNVAGASVTMSGGIVKDNTSTAATGSAIRVLATSTAVSVTINGTSVIQDNTSSNASSNGGAIFTNTNSSTTTVNVGGSALITGNKVGNAGGALYQNSGSALTVADNAVISGNTAATGGAVYQANGTLTLRDNVALIDNVATSSVAGVYWAAGTLNVRGNVKVGTASDTNGIYNARAGTSDAELITQYGDLEATARINLHGKNGATNGTRVVRKVKIDAANPTPEATVTEAAYYDWMADRALDVEPEGSSVYYRVGTQTSDWHVASYGDDAGAGTVADPLKTLPRAFHLVKPGSSSAWSAATVTVMDDIETSQVAALAANSYKHITLRSWQSDNPAVDSGRGDAWVPVADAEGRATVLRAPDNTANAFVQVNANSELIMEELIFDGNKANVSVTASLVTVDSGKLSVRNNSVLMNNRKISDVVGGGAIRMLGGTAAVSIEQSVLHSNAVTNHNGGAVSVEAGTLTIEDSKLYGNLAHYGGAVSTSGTVNITDGELYNNYANADGGAIMTHPGGIATLVDSTLRNNTSYSRGGAVRNRGTFTMTGGFITHNFTDAQLPFEGGGLSLWDGSVTLNGVTVEENKSRAGGGGIHIASGSLTVNGGVVTGNVAAGTGGGIYRQNGSSLTLNGVSVTGNTSTGNGGGVYQEQGTGVIFKGATTIQGNTATGTAVGEDVYYNTGTITIQDKPVLGTADTGMGVYMAKAVVFAQNGDLEDGSLINIEDKANAVSGDRLANKSNGDPVDDEEAEFYRFWGAYYWVKADTGLNAYVLGYYPELYVANPDASKNEGVDPAKQVPVGSDVFGVGDGSKERPFATIQKAIEIAAPGKASPWEWKDTTIYVMDDLTLSAAILPGSTDGYSHKHITVRAWRDAEDERAKPEGSQLTVTRAAAFTGHMIQTHAKSWITLADITFSGNKQQIPGYHGAVTAYVNGGALGLEQGARMVDSRSTNSGAAYVDNSGHLWMNQGGEISGNESNNADRSAGVTAGSSGKFTVYGGVLKNNVSYGARGGAVSVLSGGSFDMQGGSIEANTNTGGWGAGVYVFSGGTMTVSGESGITGNRATNAAGGGGGIAIESSGTGTAAKVTLGGNALISGNATAGVGSAVHWKLGTLTVKDAVRVGVDKKDNGIYIATAANALTQAGSLAHEARINLDGKLNATHLANAKIAGKTGAVTSDVEAGQYFYQNRSYRVVRSTQNTTDYILTAVTDFYVSPESGDDAYGLGTYEDPFKSLAKALATTVLDVPTAWHVMDDVVLDAGLVIPARVDATVHQAEQVGGTVHVSRGDALTGSLFTVVWDGKLAWDDMVMDGRGDELGQTDALVEVAGGAFTLLGGKLINNIAPEGAAVNVTAGRPVCDGVCGAQTKVYSLVIAGGEISGNTATGNGGAINLLAGGLLVSGGVITENTVSDEETGRGHGVYVNGGEIHITEYPRIGVHDLDNGVYIGYPKLQAGDGQWAKSVITLEQGDLHSGSNVNIEGKLDAVEYTIIVDKASSAPATRLESEYFRWQGEGLRLVMDQSHFYSLASVYDYYVSSTGRDDTGNGTQKYPFASIAHAFEVAAEDTARVPKPVNVHVMDDVVTKRETAVVPAGADITLQKWRMNLQSVSVTRVANFRGDLIRVEEGGTFYMRTLSVDGGEVSNTAPLLLVDGGKAVMVSGTLTGARGGAGMAAGAGSAVVVSGDGEFALHGGNVIGNGSVSDGEDVGIPVVFAAGGARVVMGGGEISGNAVMAGHGAVEFDDASAFEFYGGLIRANKSYGVVMDGGGFDVWGAPRIEATHGASGIWLADGQVITVIGDLTRGARLDVSGKGAVTGVSTADRDSVIAVKTGGAPVSKAEARYFRWVPGTLSVIKHESEQWYVLGDLDVQFLAVTPDGTAHIADSTGITLIFQGGDPGVGMEHLMVKRNGTVDLAASGALQYLGLDEGDLDDPDDDTWRYRIPIDHEVSTWDEGDTVTVTATKLGVVFDPQSRTGILHRDDRIRVEYVNAVADGEAKTVKSGTLTLTFDREIPLLSTADITLTPQTPYADAVVNTGALSGPVSRIVGGETVFDYTLGISGDWYEGDKVDVEVDKWGYLFTPDTQTATLHATKVRTEHEYVQVSANGTENVLNTTVLTLYMKVAEVADIADLVAADITVTGRTGSSATLDVDVESIGTPVAYTGSEPSLVGSYEYAATITGTWIEGDEVDVQVGKSGYLFTPNVRDTLLHRGKAVLDAYDFGIPMSKLNTFSKEEARRRARATATDDLQQPIDIDDIMVDDDEFTALTEASEEGPYDLTFSILDATPSESETETISVLVYDDSLAALSKRVINDPERDGYDLGAPVEFELAARIPDLYGIAMPMDDYTYGLVDTLPAELSLPDEDDVEVYVADSAVDVSDQVNVSVDSGARTISVEGLAELFAQKNDTNDITDIPGVVAGTDLRIRFTSVLGTDAQVSTPDSLSATVNTATLTQSTGNPEDLAETDESIATTSVHSFGVDAFKADMNDVSQGLQGATFTITRAKANDPEVMESLQFMAVNDGTDGVYRLAVTADSAPLAEVTSGTDGTLRLLGLEARELTFKETAAPDGFFTIKDFTLDISPQWQAQTGALLAVGYGIEGSQLVTDDADESRVTIANPSATVAHLPYTGSYPILILLLIGTMITLIGIAVYHRKTTRFPYGILTGMGAHRKHTPAHAKWYRSMRGALRHCD